MIRILVLLVLLFCSSAHAQRYLDETTDNVACWANTAKDGSGTDYQTLVDTDGHLQVDVLSGGGSGTEYTEDVAAPADPLGTTTVMTRDDALSTVTEAEGDWSRLRGTAEGALWTQDFNSDAILADTANIDTNIATLAGAVDGTEVQVDIVSGATSGTEYTEGATDSTITGQACMWEDASDTLRAISRTYPQPVMLGAVVDANNSTTSTLTANTDYTGTGTDVSDYEGITVSIFADQDSDANGMRFEFSSDGTNWDITEGSGFDYIANTGRQFQFGIQAQFFRVVFQNGGTNQTAFRLETLLHRGGGGLTTIHRADAEIQVDRSATLVKSILMAQVGGAGNFVPVSSSASGKLQVAAEIEDGGNSITVDATSLPLPTDASTATNQSTIIGHVDGVETLLGTIDTDTGTIASNSTTTAAGYATEGSALGSGVLLQGDDGTDRKNVNVDATTGDVQVDVTNTVTVASHAVTNAGTFAVQEDGAALTALQLIDNFIDGTEGQVDVVAALPSGTNTIGKVNVTSSATSTDGTDIYFDADGDNTVQSVKASGGLLKGWYISNQNTTECYLQIFNVASGSVTLGATTPSMSLAIPPNDGAANVLSEPGIEFSTAISVAATTTATGSTDCTTGLVVNLFYE